MQEDLIDLLLCPVCKGDLETAKKVEIIEHKSTSFIKSGLLGCKQCNSLYPVIDRIPRLLRYDSLFQEEKKGVEDMKNCSGDQVKVAAEPDISDEEKYKRIEELVKEILLEDERYRSAVESIMNPELELENEKSKKVREMVEWRIQYRVYETEKKERFVKTCAPYIMTKPEVIADIGGGAGGTISCFSKHFDPKLTLLIEIDISWAKVALLRDPKVNVIRADAANLPIKSRNISLLITTSVLEHISSWEEATEEMARVSKNAFICYGPNKWFLYDRGHVNAPLVTVLPKRAGAFLAYLFHKFILRTGYSYEVLKKEIDETFYIPRNKVVNILGEHGEVTNVFSKFLDNSVEYDVTCDFNRVKSFLKKHPELRKFSSDFIVSLGIEPQVYLMYKNKLEKSLGV